MNNSHKIKYTFTKEQCFYEYPYYDCVCQVRYIKNPQNMNEEYSTGIAFHNFIIDSKYGEPVDIQKLFAINAISKYFNYDEMIIELNWNDLTKVIKE